MIVGMVVSNILYPAGAMAVAVIVAVVIWARRRKPKSVEANVASFHRGLRALAPDVPVVPTRPTWGRAQRRSEVAGVQEAASLAGSRPAPDGDADQGQERPDAVAGPGPDPEAAKGEARAVEALGGPAPAEGDGPTPMSKAAPAWVPNEEAETG